MTGKDCKDMTTSELLRTAAAEIEELNCNTASCGVDKLRAALGVEESPLSYKVDLVNTIFDLVDKIDAELMDARADGISEGVDASLRQGAELWAKANGWPDFLEGEDFGAWLDRCTLPRPRWDTGEVVDTDDYEDLLTYSVVDDGWWVVTFADGQQEGVVSERVKRLATEVLGGDGKPIVAGETVYDIYRGEPIVVKGISRDSDGNPVVWGESDEIAMPHLLTHTPPDTQERIDSDVRKGYMSYWKCLGCSCERCPARIDGYKPWQWYRAGSCEDARMLDLLRRQRQLDEVSK